MDKETKIGNTSTQQNPTHTYQNAGAYTVYLTVTDDDADSDTTSQSITVSELAINTWASGDLELAIWSVSGHPRGRDKSKDYSYTPDSAITNVQLLRARIGVLTYDGSGSADRVPKLNSATIEEESSHTFHAIHFYHCNHN